MAEVMIDIQNLEKELLALWKADGESKPVQTRACTLNLVVCVPDAPTADSITAAVQQLTASHPNRTLMLIADTVAAEERIEAYVQANCVLAAPGVPQVCGEQITVHARGGAVQQLASVVLSLLLPDVPVVLWVIGAGALGNPLIERLRNVADRLLVDSAEALDQTASLIELARLGEELGSQRHQVSINDLNWNRLTPWRELTAQFFDTRPLLPHLRRIDRVEIEFGRTAKGDNAAEALLFGCWLASSLGWTLQATHQDEQERSLRFGRPAVNTTIGDQRTVEMLLRPVAAGAPGRLMAVRLACLDNVRAEFSVERTEDPTCARTTARADGEPEIARLARLDRGEMAELLGSELRMAGVDHTFRKALHLAQQAIGSV
jgi:glucose-6-phosphate dehydrogenase assembly protein OpcA